MKLKGIELKGTYKIVCYDTSFVVYDEKGNQIYFEDSDGFWAKWKYNEQGKVIYYEGDNGYWFNSEYDRRGNRTFYVDSYGYWSKSEFDEKGIEIYFKNSEGEIIDERVNRLQNKN